MSVTFRETMAGEVSLLEPYPDGLTRRVPITFTVEVTAPSPTAFATGATMTMAGDVRVGGLVESAPLAGTLRVDVLRSRELEYRFHFDGPPSNEGKKPEYAFVGRKRVRLHRLLKTMTWLDGTLTRDGRAIGTATLSFSLRDLPSFLRSFSLA